MQIQIIKDHPNATTPTKSRSSDAGWDLSSIDTVTIPPGERKRIPIGLRMIVDDGFYYTFAPRSGLAFSKNIIPSHYNVMDCNYTGECDVLMLNRGTEAYTIKAGDRFCQMLIHEVTEVEFSELQEDVFNSVALRKSERGSDGFGSSGQ
jgi:dUTP pyrophosphatase